MADTIKLKTSEILTLAYKHLWNGDILGMQYEYCHNVCGAVDAAFNEMNRRDLADVDSWDQYIDNQDRFHDYMALILAKTDSLYYHTHLNKLEVPRSLINNPEWVQLRRRELLCSIISHFESIND